MTTNCAAVMTVDGLCICACSGRTWEVCEVPFWEEVGYVSARQERPLEQPLNVLAVAWGVPCFVCRQAGVHDACTMGTGSF